MHRTAEFGVAAHWLYKGGRARLRRRLHVAQRDDGLAARTRPTRREFLESLRRDLYGDEVFVFTPKGELRNLPAGATPIDFAYDVHTDVGHRCVGREGQRTDRAAHLSPQLGRLRRDPDLEPAARPVARLAQAGRLDQGPLEDQAVLPQGAARGRRAPRPRRAAGSAAQGGPAEPAGGRFAAAAGGHPGDGLPEGGGLLHLDRPAARPRCRRSSTRSSRG